MSKRPYRTKSSQTSNTHRHQNGNGMVREDAVTYRTEGSHGAKKHYCIDLFAGCGGLSLGLELAGFTPLLFSEINHSAAETYIANRVGMDIIPVSDVYNLTDGDLNLLKTHWKYKGILDIDLVCGGPPCQGYSGIGHRRTFKLDKKDIPSNHLFEEMVRVISCIKPKIFLFENVRGLLQSRWTPDGESGEIFKAVLSAFKQIPGYHVRWELLHAKDYGVPQNRPRVIMVGIRHDLLPNWVQGPLSQSVHDEGTAVRCGFIPRPSGTPPSMEELISDLIDPHYADKKGTYRYTSSPLTAIQRYLRTTRDGYVLQKGDDLTDHEYSNHAEYIRDKFASMIANNGEIPEKYRTKKFAQRVFPRTWGEDGPNLTATSLPDDYVHYSQPRSPTVREWARIQTFPDWYIFAGSRTTGGRRRAGDPSLGLWSRDVPKYTQIGNAVPAMLAEKIGRHLLKIIEGEITCHHEQQTTYRS